MKHMHHTFMPKKADPQADLRNARNPRGMVHDSLARAIFANDPFQNAPEADKDAKIIEAALWQEAVDRFKHKPDAEKEIMDFYTDIKTLSTRMTDAIDKRLQEKLEEAKKPKKSDMPLEMEDPYALDQATLDAMHLTESATKQ
jgi:hypothetical protein